MNSTRWRSAFGMPFAIAATFLAFGTQWAMAATGYSFTDLGPVRSLGANQRTVSLNDAGQVVFHSPGSLLPVLWVNGTATVLPAAGGNFFTSAAVAVGISEQGVPYGGSTVPANNYVWNAVTWNAGAVFNIGADASDAAAYLNANFAGQPPYDPLSRYEVYSSKIAESASGVSVLTFTRRDLNSTFQTECPIVQSASGAITGALLLPADAGASPSLACSGSFIGGVSSAGTIVGSVNKGGSTGYIGTIWSHSGVVLATFTTVEYFSSVNVTGHATAIAKIGAGAYWNGSALQTLPSLPGNPSATTLPNAINDSDAIVGKGAGRAVIWNSPNSAPVDLNTLVDASARNAGWTLTDATAINNNGWIVGSASNPTLDPQYSHAFLLIPTGAGGDNSGDVPLPAWSLLLLGIVLVGTVFRGKRA